MYMQDGFVLGNKTLFSHIVLYILGDLTENPTLNMTKYAEIQNQVTLFVNYSYNSSCDVRSSKNM